MSEDSSYNVDNVESVCDITPDLTGCTTNLQLYPQGSSATRVQMEGVHYTQRTQIDGAELRTLFTGVERDYAKYMFNVIVEHDCRVLRVIHRFAKPGIQQPDTKPLETLVFVELINEESESSKVDLIRIPYHVSNHQTFGFELVMTRQLGKSMYLPKGTILAESKSVIDNEYCVGLQAKTILVSHPMVIEDSCLISQSLADKMMTYGYKTHSMTIGERDYPLFLYEDSNGKPALFPEVGMKVREDGILLAKREHDTILAAVEMSEHALHDPCGHYDDCIFVDPESVVIDIKVFRDDHKPKMRDRATGARMPNSKLSTPAGMQEYCDEYADALSSFQGDVRRFYKEVKAKFRHQGMYSVPMTPDAKQAITYAIADEPTEIIDGAKRFTKQFGSIKNDDYTISITIRYPIPLAISGKITDTMGGKGIVGKVVPDAEMPYDDSGVRVELMMSENAMLRRTNFNRGFENYCNAARMRIQDDINTLCDKGEYNEAWELLINFTATVNPDWSIAICDTHTTTTLRDALLDSFTEENLRLWVPSDNKITMDDVERNIRDKFPPRKSPLNIPQPDGSIIRTMKSFTIGELYMIRLDKTGREFSAIAAGRFQPFGTIAKQHSADKYSRPARETPMKHQGESETRHQQAFIGGDVCADAHDRSNNPAVADNVVMSILSADVPTNIPHAVDRKKYPLGHNRVMEINRHVLRCDGIGFTTRKS